MGKRKQRLVADNYLVTTPDGRLCVSGAARSNVVNALAKLRSLPADVTAVLGEFQATIRTLETAIGAPAPLEVSTYYELIASFEEAMAMGMQALLDMAPADELSPSIMATQHLALARAQCFRYFAESPDDEARARAYLVHGAGVSTALEASLNAAGQNILPEEGAMIADNMRSLANSFGTADPGLAYSAKELAARLDSKAPMPLARYFEQQSEVYGDLSKFFMRSLCVHQSLPPELRLKIESPVSDDELLTKGMQFALASAACGLLVGFFERHASGNDDGRPRLILN